MDIEVTAAISPVASRGNQHQIELTLKNNGSRDVLIDPFNLCEKSGLNSPIFVIVDNTGKYVEYTGKVYKRGEPDFSKFFKLKVGSKISRRCNLDKNYDFRRTSPPYRIKYSVYNMHPEIDYFEIDSNERKLMF